MEPFRILLHPSRIGVGRPVWTKDHVRLGTVKAQVTGASFKIDASPERDYWLPVSLVASAPSEAAVRLAVDASEVDGCRIEGAEERLRETAVREAGLRRIAQAAVEPGRASLRSGSGGTVPMANRTTAPTLRDWTARLAVAWGLDVLEIPLALPYVRARMLAEEGQLELVDVQPQAATDRYAYRWTDPAGRSDTLTVERPAGWDAARERRALADMRAAWEPFGAPEREDLAA